MVELSKTDGLSLDVDRGPNWLFVKLRSGDQRSSNERSSDDPSSNRRTDKPSRIDSPHFADELLSISAKHFTYRIVLELDQLNAMPEGMTGQMAILQSRLTQQGGSLKVCGLSPECEAVLRDCQLDKVLPNHASREDAVLGDSVLGIASLGDSMC